MNALLENLLISGPVVTDGAWGTALQSQGLRIGRCPDEWNLTHATEVEDVARGYVEAGSQIILTNTFGASPILLDRYGLGHKTEDINAAGVEISLRAARDAALVFASIGPTGKLLLTGDVSQQELAEAFGEQASALAGAGADAIVIETMSDLPEAEIAVTAAVATALPVVACMTFDSGPHKDRTMMGVEPKQAADRLMTAGADVIGSNCGQGMTGQAIVCRMIAEVSRGPVWIKANAGLPELVDGCAVYRTSPEEFAAGSKGLIDAGAMFIGGCCGTTPASISALRGVISA